MVDTRRWNTRAGSVSFSLSDDSSATDAATPADDVWDVGGNGDGNGDGVFADADDEDGGCGEMGGANDSTAGNGDGGKHFFFEHSFLLFTILRAVDSIFLLASFTLFAFVLRLSSAEAFIYIFPFTFSFCLLAVSHSFHSGCYPVSNFARLLFVSFVFAANCAIDIVAVCQTISHHVRIHHPNLIIIS